MMVRHSFPTVALALGLLAPIDGCACQRTTTTHAPIASASSSATPTATPHASIAASSSETPVVASASVDPPREIGPYEVPFLGKRNVYFVVPKTKRKDHRLLTNLHGVCNPPGYACGYWATTAATFGFLVCPTGNDSCGKAMYDAPTWTESDDKIDSDLEAAVAKVDELYPNEISREGSVLTGFSKGAYTAVKIAQKHPGRWPYLVLNEANVSLSVPMLEKAKVRAVALIAGEIGGQVAGERATVNALVAKGYPAKLWVMPKAGHYYSENIADIMKEAIEFVTSY